MLALLSVVYFYRCNFTAIHKRLKRSHNAIDNQNDFIAKILYILTCKLSILKLLRPFYHVWNLYVRSFHFWLYSGMLWHRLQTFKHLVLILTQQITANESELIHAIYYSFMKVALVNSNYHRRILQNFMRISSTNLKIVLLGIGIV